MIKNFWLMMDMITPDADDHVQVGAIFDLANIHRF